jgi:type IV pilus assembly protein PilX
MPIRLVRQSPRFQQGVALIVVLIFLLAISAIAAFSARNATLGESLARNELDNQLARQAAEAALRDAERDLLLQDTVVSTALCQRGTERPVLQNIAAFDNETQRCLRGQCLGTEGVNFSTAAASSPESACPTTSEAWWPVSKGGCWNTVFANKPSPENGAVNCTTFWGGVPLGTFTGAPPIAGVSHQPEYLIEYFPKGMTPLFRITARGFGYSEATQAVMQSYFKPFQE